MRYFFNLANAQDFKADEDGVEVADPAKLRATVTQYIEEVLLADPAAARHWRGWRLEVAEPSGAVLLSINLDDYAP